MPGTHSAHSEKAGLCWREHCGMNMPSYCPTRWSKWEVMKAVMVQFGDIESFLRAQDDLPLATCSKLLGIISDPAKNG